MDRNIDRVRSASILIMSLSARRAWIEIGLSFARKIRPVVALRKESVDRNGLGIGHYCYDVSSLSARRAWIEIWSAVLTELLILLSLSARRAWIEIIFLLPLVLISRRSPQGERG